MKKLWMMITALLILLVGCGKAENETEENTNVEKDTEQTIKVATASSIEIVSEIMEIAEKLLAEQGIQLENVVVSDNIQPNTALAEKEVDANFFQHALWMQTFNENNNSNLVVVEPVYHAALGLYSKEYKSMEELPEGATIAVPNDPTNLGRALAFLDAKGVIQLKDGTGIYGTLQDIEKNPKKYQFKEVDLLMLARMYDDVDASVMYPSYAMPLNLSPSKDALLVEDPIDDFAISLVAREDNADSELVQKLADAVTSPEVKQFLEENYPESAAPAFE
ncbi:MetQ/NlpA family ABC transporter substrate-binding protein [Pallidibacillus thermolactis]|uniref:MetQ/NlpA family ABC transporter substrate-binding protein n=1 Tax=Pallidibacillus thermolactis TaxID=251051 RepID=UPI0021D8A2C0|nr:MetQ/NlpA family ABC transporter substrate-binding protein [Pallidibacillus thermolactis]MCU9601126.1 MetQ/NlpA family ABC transporter substrate-binding protein [Pallidibacillus thermolactis subsp. kokeshiiformis]